MSCHEASGTWRGFNHCTAHVGWSGHISRPPISTTRQAYVMAEEQQGWCENPGCTNVATDRGVCGDHFAFNDAVAHAMKRLLDSAELVEAVSLLVRGEEGRGDVGAVAGAGVGAGTVAGADAGAGFGAGMVGVTTARPTAGAAVRRLAPPTKVQASKVPQPRARAPKIQPVPAIPPTTCTSLASSSRGVPSSPAVISRPWNAVGRNLCLPGQQPTPMQVTLEQARPPTRVHHLNNPVRQPEGQQQQQRGKQHQQGGQQQQQGERQAHGMERDSGACWWSDLCSNRHKHQGGCNLNVQSEAHIEKEAAPANDTDDESHAATVGVRHVESVAAVVEMHLDQQQQVDAAVRVPTSQWPQRPQNAMISDSTDPTSMKEVAEDSGIHIRKRKAATVVKPEHIPSRGPLKDTDGKWLDSILAMDASSRNQICYRSNMPNEEHRSLAEASKKYKRRQTQARWYKKSQHKQIFEEECQRLIKRQQLTGDGVVDTELLAKLNAAYNEYDGTAASDGSTPLHLTIMHANRKLRDSKGEWESWLLEMRVAQRRQLTSHMSQEDRSDLQRSVAKFKGKLRTRRLRERESENTEIRKKAWKEASVGTAGTAEVSP